MSRDGERRYEAVFVGGGLSALSLLAELATSPPRSIAVVDTLHPLERPPVHWSYWSSGDIPYDHCALGTWERASISGGRSERFERFESIAPFTLRLVRSTEVLAYLLEELSSLPIEWLHAPACSIDRRPDGLYEVSTDLSTGPESLVSDWVFDSAPGLAPEFPEPRGPQALLGGPSLRVRSDRPVFDAGSATLFDPLDARSFAYLLPLSSSEALLESASFGPEPVECSPKPLQGYLRERYPEAAFEPVSVEYGSIPLGFAPRKTTGPGHVLLGAKRGLVKPSAGYGVANIARESRRLARLWREGSPLPPTRRSEKRWQALDAGFLGLAARDPRRVVLLLERVMRRAPLADSLRLIDETLPDRRLLPLVLAALPALLPAGRRSIDGR